MVQDMDCTVIRTFKDLQKYIEYKSNGLLTLKYTVLYRCKDTFSIDYYNLIIEAHICCNSSSHILNTFAIRSCCNNEDTLIDEMIKNILLFIKFGKTCEDMKDLNDNYISYYSWEDSIKIAKFIQNARKYTGYSNY